MKLQQRRLLARGCPARAEARGLDQDQGRRLARERTLQEQALEAELEKLAVGATAQAQVIQLQRDLAQARSAQVNAMNSYLKAKLALERAAGVLLAAYRVDVQQVQ